jgi:hypothetical protein
MPRTAANKEPNPILLCPVCLSDDLDVISVRMKKCNSCGFIWNHEVSDRDNLLLIVEHQTKLDALRPEPAPPSLKIVKPKKGKERQTRKKKK